MTTTAPRVKAGGPPPLQLHRGIVAPIPSAYKTRPLQIDFVLPDEDEDAVRAGFDRVMKMPIGMPVDPLQPGEISKPFTSDATKDLKASDFAFWFWTRAMWTACWFGLGVIYARNFY